MNEQPSEILYPGIDIKPQITIDECGNLLEKLYGIKYKSIVELNAYDDKNCKIIVSVCNNKYISEICKDGYVLKILNSFDSKKIDFVNAQNEMMIFLGKHNIKCSRPVLNMKGEYYSIEKLKSSEEHIVRLLEFLPGKIFCDVPPTNQLFFDAGQYLANLDLTFKNFHHDAYKTHRSLWMLDSIPNIKQFFYVITDKEDLKMIEEIIDEFERLVLKDIDTLEKGIIHGDFNEQNIIVRETEKGNFVVDAILDFGDSQYSCLLFELAIACAYMIIQAKDLNMVEQFLAGYSTVRPIVEQEYKLLKICIAARLCQSLVMGVHSYLQHPENKYVLSTQATGWTLLRKLWNESNEKLMQNWRLEAK